MRAEDITRLLQRQPCPLLRLHVTGGMVLKSTTPIWSSSVGPRSNSFYRLVMRANGKRSSIPCTSFGSRSSRRCLDAASHFPSRTRCGLFFQLYLLVNSLGLSVSWPRSVSTTYTSWFSIPGVPR